MNKPKTKLAEAAKTPVFPDILHHVRMRTGKAIAQPKAARRDNTFSQSRDTREDRGERQMKTAHNAQTFPHAR